ncbi:MULTISPECIES: carbohydrate ABC transporter permease [unclassified Microbacterium]|uniref:carbohydrate ABC transporter permease n=1 Tax=unclassified Microbacterium TaxID=2609290 RepID=UPI00214CF782|nr:MULTISPECIES: carbohydrate ABC transporter permease [unclassified Microbacterium]MCR2801989.1 carbohydrate ABC transporter permease [Microbacterium sp. zg.Y818]MCR2824707.1 carbohydrate ABC transporter permease [Microbacterium sp. zg.Y909]WIM22545.1 carbohydrate ABC transporter permease [Microbacterium sp. zg-Y818]
MSATSVIEETADVVPTPGARKPGFSPRRKASRSYGEGRRAGWLTYAVLGLVIVISAFPFYWSIVVGSWTNQIIYSSDITLTVGPNLWDSITRVLSADINFAAATLNSIIVSATTSLSVVLFSTLAGFSFAKLKFRGANALLIAVIATMAVPTQLGIVPLYLLMGELDLQGNLLAVILPGLVTAFGVFWMTQYLREGLPDELIDAARVDGASMIKTFWHVALPAARPAAAMLFLFTFVGSWTNFFWPYVILDNRNGTLPVALQGLQSQYYTDFPLILTGALLSTLPLLIMFVFVGKQLVSGIMAGAVKG